MNLACRLFPAHISSGLNYRYAYNNKGLMTSRSESVLNHLEKYNYDNLDRLTQVTSGKIGETGVLQTFSYAGNGNLNINAQGNYVYGINGNPNNKPHAVTKINNANSCPPSTVTYNFFNQPTKVTEGNYQFDLYYGADQQRNKVVINDGKESATRYLVSKCYEVEKINRQPAPISKHYHYIYGENGVVALHIAKSGTDSTYYIHTDHLGSYCAITDKNKKVVQRNRFEPWGNPIGTANFSLVLRGFTGHEHYPQFKIINMNGRLYDPVIGRFLSPDNYVQRPGFTQSYNRYSYCLNNPLKYVDRTGQWYDDYDDYDDNYYDDDEYGPKNPWGSGSFQNYLASTGLFNQTTSESDSYDERNDPPYADIDPYDTDGFSGPWDPTEEPKPPKPGPKGSGAAAGLAGTIWGGAASLTAAEAKVTTSVLSNGMKYLKIGGGVVGGIGFVPTAYNTVQQIRNNTINTADVVDLGASAGLLITGLMLTNPVGIGVVVGVGMAYGVYRLAGGERADIWINDKFGFRPK